MFTLKAPFPDITNNNQVIAMIMNGSSPRRPPQSEGVLDGFWDTIEQCWDREPHLRRSSRQLMSLPLRVSALETYNPLVHSHAEWSPPVSEVPPLSGTHILDSCLLHLLDVSTTKSWTNPILRLRKIGCPSDAVQFVENILKNSDSPAIEGRSRGFQTASQDDWRSLHRTPKSTVKTKRSPQGLDRSIPVFASREWQRQIVCLVSFHFSNLN